jgi:hypothetical protein
MEGRTMTAPEPSTVTPFCEAMPKGVLCGLPATKQTPLPLGGEVAHHCDDHGLSIGSGSEPLAVTRPSIPAQGDPCGACGNTTFFPRWSPDLRVWLCLICQEIEDEQTAKPSGKGSS